MPITAHAIAILSDNYAWLLKDDTGATAIVDPAETAPCLAAIEAAGGRLDMILITHHHHDHIASVDAIRAQYHCPVIGAAMDERRLPPLDRAVRAGDTVMLGDTPLAVIDTPGHTLGHIAYAGGGVVLCGDTLFSLGCGRLLEGTPADMFGSLHRLAALPPGTLVCCGHEYTQANARFATYVDPANEALQVRATQVDRLRAVNQPTVPTRLSDELATNPFLRAPDIPTLATLRSQKDTFK